MTYHIVSRVLCYTEPVLFHSRINLAVYLKVQAVLVLLSFLVFLLLRRIARNIISICVVLFCKYFLIISCKKNIKENQAFNKQLQIFGDRTKNTKYINKASSNKIITSCEDMKYP